MVDGPTFIAFLNVPITVIGSPSFIDRVPKLKTENREIFIITLELKGSVLITFS